MRLHTLSAQAFLETWGTPTYIHRERTQLLEMNDGALMPLSRIPLDQSPSAWEGGVVSGDTVYLAYADQGFLLVFFEDRLVYREQLTGNHIHNLGKLWQHEARFKTRLEMTDTP